MGWLNNIFGRGKPKGPTIRRGTQRGPGHSGIAAGNLRKPDLSPENVARWRTLTGEQVDSFVYDQEPLLVHSTNVSMAQYFIDTNQMMVQYKNGESYMYSNVSEQEASIFVNAQSKGTACWDLFRVRGKGNSKLHKKPYRKI